MTDTPKDNNKDGKQPDNIISVVQSVKDRALSEGKDVRNKNWQIFLSDGSDLRVFGQLSVQRVIAVFGEDTFDVRFVSPIENVLYVIEVDQ